MPRNKGSEPPKSSTERSRAFRARRAEELERLRAHEVRTKHLSKAKKTGDLAKYFEEAENVRERAEKLWWSLFYAERRIIELTKIIRSLGGTIPPKSLPRKRSQRK